MLIPAWAVLGCHGCLRSCSNPVMFVMFVSVIRRKCVFSVEVEVTIPASECCSGGGASPSNQVENFGLLLGRWCGPSNQVQKKGLRSDMRSDLRSLESAI